MTRRDLVLEAPAVCPACGYPDVCLHYAPGESFADLHCRSDDLIPGLCGWRETHFVGMGQSFTVVTRDDDPEREGPNSR